MNVALDTAIARSGGVEVVAKGLGVSSAVVYLWRADGAIPPRRVERFCELTGCAPWDANPTVLGWLRDWKPPAPQIGGEYAEALAAAAAASRRVKLLVMHRNRAETEAIWRERDIPVRRAQREERELTRAAERLATSVPAEVTDA